MMKNISGKSYVVDLKRIFTNYGRKKTSDVASKVFRVAGINNQHHKLFKF